jgi:hypothetical protein
MKHRGFIAVCLVWLACITASSVFGDERTVNLESFIIDSFDGDSKYEWKENHSRFATKLDDTVFPKLNLVEAWPQALFGTNRQGRELKSLGIWGKFDRRGYNWIDLYPVLKEGGEDAGPYEIPIPGRAHYVDLWVWGSNLNYYIEAYLRDYQGVIHVLHLGNMGFQGWRNLRTWIPSNIPQRNRILPDLTKDTFVDAPDKTSIYLKFVKFRVWTTPAERVDNFYMYFDQFKVLTDTFESLYDGDELNDPEHIQDLWGSLN